MQRNTTFFILRLFCIFSMLFMVIFITDLLLEKDLSSVKKEIKIPIVRNDDVVLLSGWQGQKAESVLWSKDKTAGISLNMDKGTGYFLQVDLMPKKISNNFSSFDINVYFNKVKVGDFSTYGYDKWHKYKIYIPKNLIKDNFNKLYFVNENSRESFYGLRNFSFANYGNIWYAFPRGKVFLKKPGWFYGNNTKQKIISSCKRSMPVFLTVMLSVFIAWFITKADFSQTVEAAIYAFSPGFLVAVIYFFLFSFLRITPLVYKYDFLIASFLIFSFLWVCFVIKNISLCKIKAIFRIKWFSWKLNLSKFIFSAFILMLFFSALLFVQDKKELSDKISIAAYMIIAAIIVNNILELKNK